MRTATSSPDASAMSGLRDHLHERTRVHEAEHVDEPFDRRLPRGELLAGHRWARVAVTQSSIASMHEVTVRVIGRF